MAEPRDTFAYLGEIEHRLKAAAALLSVSENTLRTMLQECGFEIKRANQNNPDAPAVRLFDIPTIFALAAWRRDKKPKLLEGKKPVIIAVEIIKGGTGKSTTACEVAVQLQLQGIKVAVFDLDTQSNLTQLFGYEADLEESEAAAYGLTKNAIVQGTFADICLPLLDQERKSRSNPSSQLSDVSTAIKRPFGPDGPSLIPSDAFFSDLEVAIGNSRGVRELFFRRVFNLSLEGKVPGLNIGDYDVIILDCPPSVSLVSSNAIAAADIIIAPVKMESFSVKGLSKLVQEKNSLQEAYPADLKDPSELVILPTFYSTNLKRVARMQERMAQYRDSMMPCSISQSEEFPTSIEAYLPLTLMKPTSAPVKEYRMFVDHLIKRIQAVAKRKAVNSPALG